MDTQDLLLEFLNKTDRHERERVAMEMRIMTRLAEIDKRFDYIERMLFGAS